MTTYLEGGWYEPGAQKTLRAEVIDGAMDIAGTLLRSGVPAAILQRLALKMRGLVTVSDPHLRGATSFGERERTAILLAIEPLLLERPALAAFVADCLEHVTGTTDLFALYLHLVHVTRMMQLLSVVTAGDGGDGGARATKTRGTAGDRAARRPAPRAAAPSRAKKKPARKKRATRR